MGKVYNSQNVKYYFVDEKAWVEEKEPSVKFYHLTSKKEFVFADMLFSNFKNLIGKFLEWRLKEKQNK